MARGLFAQALIDAMPELPVADEERLGDAGTRASFLARVLAHPVSRILYRRD
jgi:hypothetical protein